MLDKLNQKLNVGDIVVAAHWKYRDVYTAEVLGFTELSVKLRHLETGAVGRSEPQRLINISLLRTNNPELFL